MRHTILRLTIAFAALLTAVYAFASEYPIGNTAYPSGWIVTPGSQGFDIAEGAMWFGSDMVLYGGLGRTCTLDTSTWQSTWHAAPIQERWISGVAVGTGCWFGSQEGTIMSRHPSGGWTHIARHNSDAVVELIKLHNEVVSVWRSGRVETIDIYDTRSFLLCSMDRRCMFFPTMVSFTVAIHPGRGQGMSSRSTILKLDRLASTHQVRSSWDRRERGFNG
jgi:hypothetical protein